MLNAQFLRLGSTSINLNGQFGSEPRSYIEYRVIFSPSSPQAANIEYIVLLRTMRKNL